jgi:hypothetical protein
LSRDGRLDRLHWDAGRPSYVSRQDHHAPLQLLAPSMRTPPATTSPTVKSRSDA